MGFAVVQDQPFQGERLYYEINDVFNPLLVLWRMRMLNLQSKNLQVNALIPYPSHHVYTSTASLSCHFLSSTFFAPCLSTNDS
jgi:hypothetical protein